MRTYRQKIKQIKVIRDYIAGILDGVAGRVVTTRGEVLNATDWPIVGVIYQGGTSEGARENGNAVLTFAIVYRNRINDEMDELDAVGKLAEKFEDYSMGGNCIGAIPEFPIMGVDAANETKLFESIINIEIEI